MSEDILVNSTIMMYTQEATKNPGLLWGIYHFKFLEQKTYIVCVSMPTSLGSKALRKPQIQGMYRALKEPHHRKEQLSATKQHIINPVNAAKQCINSKICHYCLLKDKPSKSTLSIAGQLTLLELYWHCFKTVTFSNMEDLQCLNNSCNYTHTHTHTPLTALFRDYPGEPVPER